MNETGDRQGALNALLGPLRYAARNSFANLSRIQQFEQTIQRGVERILPFVLDQKLSQPLKESVPRLDDTLEIKKRKSQDLLAMVDVLQKDWNQNEDVLATTVTEDSSAKTTDDTTTAKSQTRPVVSKLGATKLSDLRTTKPLSGRTQTRFDGAEKSGAIASRNHTVHLSASKISGVGPKVQAQLAELGIMTVKDILYRLPRRYDEHRAGISFDQFQENIVTQIEGTVQQVSQRRFRGQYRLEVGLRLSSGTCWLLWFRQPYKGFGTKLQRGDSLSVRGKLKRYKGRWQMTHPSLVTEHTESQEQAWIPVYVDSEKLPARRLQGLIQRALKLLPFEETLPHKLLQERLLPEVSESLVALHRPPKETNPHALNHFQTPWHRRLIYEELLSMQLMVLARRMDASAQNGKGVAFTQPLLTLAKDLFPFELTGAQQRVLRYLEQGLQSDVPLSVLVQGDVGSGKTAVALTAAAAVAKAGLQVAIMAPTEVLAEQHMRAASNALMPQHIRIGLLSGSLTAAEKRETLMHLKTGHIKVVVGTHALIQESVAFKSLALAIVDEQHRFGVLQRGRFLELGMQGRGVMPHMLVMTATPIPRTLAMSVYGDLDVSIIDERPPGRKPIQTRLIYGPQRHLMHQMVLERLQQGQQAYIVFPLVQESEAEGMESIKDATSAAEELANGPFRAFKVGLLHGRMSGDEKDHVMRLYARGEIQVLVSTTVIEVGIDVPNATVMVVENAERFGLSQLHQLRGRVGRGEHASLCILIAEHARSQEAKRRLQVMTETDDGFKIAEEDLAIRGPGDFMGTRQSGLPLLSIADLVRDVALMEVAREDAQHILSFDPQLKHPEHHGLRTTLLNNLQEQNNLSQIA